MAEKWKNQDSARTMTRKFNETVEQVNKIADSTDYTKFERSIQKIHDTLESKLDTEIGEKALGEMLTSEPIGEIDMPSVGLLTRISISGRKLLFTTNDAKADQRISIFINNNRMVFVTL